MYTYYEVVLVDRETCEEKLIGVYNDVDEAADKAWEYNVDHFGRFLMEHAIYIELCHDGRYGNELPNEKYYADYHEVTKDESKIEKKNKDMKNEIEKIDWTNAEMVSVGVYKDSTGLYTECECNEDNWVQIEFPKAIVEEWYWTTLVHTVNPGYTMEKWLKEESTDEPEQGDLIGFAKERGFEIKRPDNRNSFVISVMEQIEDMNDENYEYVMENIGEAIDVARHCGSIYDLDRMVHLKELLHFAVSYEMYHFISNEINDYDCLDLVEKDVDSINEMIIKYANGKENV